MVDRRASAGRYFKHDGYFGNPTNSDIAMATEVHNPGNCFHDNTDPNGVTSDPPDIQNPAVMGTCGVPNSGDTTVLALAPTPGAADTLAVRAATVPPSGGARR